MRFIIATDVLLGVAILSSAVANVSCGEVAVPQPDTEAKVHRPVHNPTDLEKRDINGYVILCNQPIYRPDCVNSPYTTGNCYGLDGKWSGVLHTVAPVLGGANASCNIFQHDHCTGESVSGIIAQFPPADPGFGPWRSIQCFDGHWNDCHAGNPACGTERRSIDEEEPEAVLDSLMKRNALIPSNIPVAENIDGYIYFCSLPGFTGDCFVYEYRTKECHNLADNIRYSQSATPLKGSDSDCILYRDADCKGDQSHAIAYPGIDNFETHGLYGPFGSWSCDCGTACPKDSKSPQLVDISSTKKRDASAVSTPSNPAPDDQDKPLHPKMHVYICSEADWKGLCYNYEANAGQCLNLPYPFHGIL
ncbi:hypothetical protein LTR95_017372, partial [Oleoguttula sp. CCFEE 5521]